MEGSEARCQPRTRLNPNSLDGLDVDSDRPHRPLSPLLACSGKSLEQLCRRSFASPEMLRKHEKKSKLHKENLAAAAAQAAASGGNPDATEAGGGGLGVPVGGVFS